MLSQFIADLRDVPLAEASTQAAIVIKYFAAGIILSQGSLIGTFGSRYAKDGKTRLICSLIFAMHAALAAMVIWLA
ncbi:MAG: hypothetical protein WC714_14905 [Candidatus Obscuribacterales bacterium]|jgi:hypothetical protein